jgi:hypothetical protein
VVTIRLTTAGRQAQVSAWVLYPTLGTRAENNIAAAKVMRTPQPPTALALNLGPKVWPAIGLRRAHEGYPHPLDQRRPIVRQLDDRINPMGNQPVPSRIHR